MLLYLSTTLTSTVASDSVIKYKVTEESLCLVTLVLIVAQISLLSGAHLTAVTSVLDDIHSTLTAQSVVTAYTLARVLTVHLLTHTVHGY